MSEMIVQTRGLTKAFGLNPVLKEIDVGIARGEIWGLLGENGAGKSTFMKILSGIHQPSGGVLEFEGRPVVFSSPSEAQAQGIGLVPQEFNLAADLTVEENIFLGNEQAFRGGVLKRTAMKERARELLAEMGANVRPEDTIDRLSAAQKQLVEICKALVLDAKLLILDEPTTVLTKREIDRLLDLMRSLKARGMTMVYISHKLAEVKAICDQVAVLRDGKLVHQGPTSELQPADMARLMVGRELREIYPPKTPGTGAVVLDVRDLGSPGAFEGIRFDLRAGEILGLAGLVGAGRTEVAEAVMGLRPSRGQILLDGAVYAPRNCAAAIRQGISYLSEDRQGTGILTGFSIAENMTLVSLDAFSNRFSVVDRKKEQAKAQWWKDRFKIKATDLNAALDSLSGGNQQKVSLAKSLEPGPKVVIVDEPTRGVDIAAKHEIYTFLAELAASGIAILLISSEMEEIIGLSHRVVVMREGALAGELVGEAIQENNIMFLATGIREGVH